MDNFLNRLYRNPYAPLDAASITRVDDAGNGYDDWNNMIAPATAPHKQTWGEIGQNALMSPVRIGASLLDSINPYQANEHPITEPDASNWRVPPLATETWNAISAPGRAYYEGMSPEEMQHTAATAAGLMMGGGGITSGLESAAARGGVSLGDRVMAKYLDWKHPNTWQTPTPDVSSSKLAWRYGADLNTNDILQRYSPMEVRAGNMFGEPDLSKLNRYQTELLNKLTSDDARYADLNRRSMEAYGVGYEGLTPTQTRHIRDGIEPPKQKPSFSVIDGGLAANADSRPGIMQALSSAYAPDNSLYMFGGKNAKTADLAKLSLAEELAAKGADRNTIWNETGWFQGPDQKWRFEIDDSNSMIPFKTQERVINDGYDSGSMLRGALKHDDLFAAYPDLSRTKWQLGKTENVKSGSYEPDNSGMHNQHFIEANGPITSDMHSILLHEGQHALQGIEGFANGAGANTFTQQADAQLASKALSWRREMERHQGDLSHRDNLVSEEYAAMGAPDWVPPREARDIAMDYGGNPNDQLEAVRNLYGLDRRTTPYTPREMYNRTAGEVEARNVQTRMNMNADERRATPPWETQDIPYEDQIVRMLAANASKEAGAGALANALDMSPEARLARAREMGFDTDRVLYHGTGKTFDEFNPGTRGNGSQRRIYLTDNPDIADIYANSENYGLKGGGDPMIYPVFAKAEKPLIVSDKGADGSFGWVSDNLAAALGVERPGPGKYASLYEEAKRQGYDQVQIREMTDLGGPQTQYIPLKPEYIRSVNAAFDPSKSDSSNLLAANASKEAGAGAIANALDERPGIIAYHGSPHDFDKFDLSKIGTGEGAQAYGSGLYFAENEGVAKAYRDTLAPDHAKYAAGNYKAVYGDGALDAAMRDGDTVAAEYLKAEKEGTAKAPGHMYQVRINANPEDFLDWDKPLSQQSEKVRNLAEKMGIPLDKPSRDWTQNGTTWNLGTMDDYPLPFGSVKHRPAYNDYDTNYYSRGVGGGTYFKNVEDAKKWVEDQTALLPDNRKGSDLYNSLSADSVEASRLLKEAGVPGISYYDQLSRSRPELDQLINGTRNHVILDDNLIEILKKYGWLAPGANLGNNSLSPQERE